MGAVRTPIIGGPRLSPRHRLAHPAYTLNCEEPEKAGLPDLVSEHVHVPDSAGANADLKVACLVAGMIAGADSIADMDLVRHGGMGKLFTGSRAPTTLGTHLRAFTFGHLRQLDAVASRLLVNLAGRVPALLGGAGQVAYLDIDDTIRATHGYAKQGVGYGYTKVKGLNVQVATVSTPTAAPVIAATRLRKGNTSSAHGAARLIADGLSTARKAGATGLVTVRADSAYYNHAVIAATARAGAHFSVTARMDARVTAAITRIPEDAWVGTKYPAGDLGTTLDLRCRGRRDLLHRVHLPAQRRSTSPRG